MQQAVNFEVSGAPLPTQSVPQPRTAHPGPSSDNQCQLLVRSLAGDMPLRMAAADPFYRPNLSAAAMRLRRFVSFYPAFGGAALFSAGGFMRTNTEFRERAEAIDSPVFDDAPAAGMLGILRDDALAAAVGGSGSDALVYAGVECPFGKAACGILIARLR